MLDRKEGDRVCVFATLVLGLANIGASAAQCTRSMDFFVNAGVYSDLMIPPGDVGRSRIFPLMEAARRKCMEYRTAELKRLQLPNNTPEEARVDHSALRLALLLVATPSSISTYQPFINLWRCYAQRHGLDFILETDETLVSSRRLAPYWMRWFSMQRHIPFYDYVVSIDADAFVAPSCWDRSIVQLALLDPRPRRLPDVVMREVFPKQAMNSAMVILRNSSRGRFFLQLMLEKARWGHMLLWDQGAFDETVLEVLSLEHQGSETYESDCLGWALYNQVGGQSASEYALCWWYTTRRLAGRAGHRRSRFVRFLDPRIADINHVVGYRGTSAPAFVYHFAGPEKVWSELPAKFGLPAEQMGDCRAVYNYVDVASSRTPCVSGNPEFRRWAVVCPGAAHMIC